ncbi:MAG: Uma2 family endonuclease [Gloeocapsa sp. UFS-A4-WI-NPMV-4B04]|jgi:Uma2 family endonuclease/predicted nucleotidyltransferase|nr:Uma2 family endonuclease [Gloeocapsa sp. UFS-A4-WI-NPMV-4B04]
MTSKLFDEFVDAGPEAKLELIESQLVVGNTLVGSRLLLRQILTGWGAGAAIAFAPIEEWLEALRVTYDAPKAYLNQDSLEALQAWSTSIVTSPEDLIPGSRGENFWHHNQIRTCMEYALWGIHEALAGNTFSRDFVMRLGDNGFTPDVIFFKEPPCNTVYEYYLEGSAELVVEVLLPGHEYQDRVVKWNYYQDAGVPEYWIVNPALEQVEFWRLVDGTYQRQILDNDGCYCPSSVPKLVFHPEHLWSEARELHQRNRFDSPIFSVEGERHEGLQRRFINNGLGWGCVSFAPQVQLKPVPISFEQYIAWCPEAKFEFWDGRPQIGGRIGIRNLIGMLLMTFGLAEAVKLLPPTQWVSALLETTAFIRNDTERKAAWWQLARQAAALLREKYGMTRLGVIGDLVRSEPLNYWSEIEIVTWELEKSDYQIYHDLSELSQNPEIEIISAERKYLRAEQKHSIINELVEI